MHYNYLPNFISNTLKYVTGFVETVYEIINFKDFKALQPAKDCEHANEAYTEVRPFYCV